VVSLSLPASPVTRTDRARLEVVPTWEEIARDQGRFIYTVAYRLTGSASDADDLVQDVLLRVQRGLATYTPGNLRGWLSRITTNAFLDSVRRAKRRPTSALPDDIDRVLPASAAADVDSASRRLPEDLQDALLELPAEFRAAVVLSDVVGLAYQDVADALSVPVGTVRSRIHRGRSRLREILA
jgi:RNA polymerase sigma-70 factor (ECF subfamily)